MFNTGNNPPPTRYNGIRTLSSIFNTTIPILFGQHRCSWKLIWYGDFVSAKAQEPGGSGFNKGGSQYVYTAALIGLVCHGPCSYLLSVWDGVGRFVVQSTSENYTVPPGGGSYQVSKHAILNGDQGVSYASPYSISFNDYGSPGSVTQSGTQQIPMMKTSGSPAYAEYTFNGGTGSYGFGASMSGQVVTISYSYFRYEIITNELAVVPLTGPYQITVQNQPEFTSDDGVVYYPSGASLTPVSGTPTVTGTYNPNGGNYLFAPGDAGAGVNISYQFQDPNTDNNAPNQLNLTFFAGEQSQAVWSFLDTNYSGQALGYTELCYIASSALYLGYTPAIPQYTFEIAGLNQFGGGVVDSNPADDTASLLTSTIFGIGFKPAWIDYSLQGAGPFQLTSVNSLGVYTGIITGGASDAYVGIPVTVRGFSNAANNQTNKVITASTATSITLGGTTVSETPANPAVAFQSNAAKTYWAANNFFISALLDNQASCQSVIGDWLEAGQVYCYWSEGLLKFTCLGDTTAIANGYQFSPPTNPVVSLDYDDMVITGNQDPIRVTRSPWQSRWNRVQIGWAVRTNDYNDDILYAQDEASIDRFGLMLESPKTWEFLTTEAAAQWAANLRVQRSVSIVNRYEFTIKGSYDYLEPGDVIQVTDGIAVSGFPVGPLGLFETPVRLLKVTNDPKKGISCEAEDFPWSIGTAVLYAKQGQFPGGDPDGPHADPGNTAPVIFEVPGPLGLFNGNNLYLFANGENPNWGGCQVWVSYDGVSYNLFGTINTPGRLGVTTNDFPEHSDPDLVDTLNVNMQQSGAVLTSVSTVNWNALVSLSAVLSPAPATITELATAGTSFPSLPELVSWTNPGDVGSLTSYATVSAGPFGLPVAQLRATGFDFALPFGFSITGVEVTINAYQNDTGPLSVEAFLIHENQYIGSMRTASVPSGSSGTDVTFGSSSDLWGLTSSVIMDDSGDTSFGVLLVVDGLPSIDWFVRNVRITLTGVAFTALELVAYENANLIGTDTYALTDFHRGVYDTTPMDHPIGSVFARLDQASLIYQYNPNYSGSEIYLKFLSFNLYGNELQTLAEVVAYPILLLGVGAQAFDSATGNLLMGTEQNSVQLMDSAITAVHGSIAGGVQNVPGGSVFSVPTGTIFGVPDWNPNVPADSAAVPSSSSAPGIAGQVAQDGTYIYICVATGSGPGTWMRIAMSSF
jgi:Putative phage tail protein